LPSASVTTVVTIVVGNSPRITPTKAEPFSNSWQAARGRAMTDENRGFLIRLSIHANDRIDAGQVRRLIEYLGGTSTVEGYSFPSAARRAEAIGLLANRFGSKYFFVEDG
jgi:hypothetical protein